MWPFKTEPKPEPPMSCKYSDLHTFGPRYNEEPLVVFTAADLIAIEQSNAQTVKASPKGFTLVITQDQLDKVAKASVRRTYLGEACQGCGAFVRYEGPPHPLTRRSDS
jgi:hypothetical protein